MGRRETGIQNGLKVFSKCHSLSEFLYSLPSALLPNSHEARLFLSVVKAHSELSMSVGGREEGRKKREERKGEERGGESKEREGRGEEGRKGREKAPLEPVSHGEKICPLPCGVYLSSWQN